MINKIIDFSINNKFIIGLFTLGILLGGIYSMTQIPVGAVPDITNNQVQVITQAPNLGTEEIEQFITYPVELAMSNLPDVKEIRSISRFGLSVVTIVFDDKVGTYLPRQLVSEKLPEIQGDIPEGFGKPTMGPISTGLGEIYQYTLEVDEEYRNTYDATELRTMQDWIVRRQMAMVPGVIEVNAFGGKVKQYEVAVKPNELRAIGITISDIFKALEDNNQNTGGAYIEKNHQANFIRGEGLIKTVSDIENIVIKTVNNIPIRIKNVATVGIGSAVRYGALTKDGEGEAVGGMILMLKGANTNNVIDNVKKRMSQIQTSLPEGVRIEPFLDRSTLIGQTTSTVTTNLLEGGLIVIFVLVLLLGNWRGGLIVASTIPLSLLFAFILMNTFGVWANLMSLGAIDFGIIVDGSVIIVEATVFLIASQVRKRNGLSQADRDSLTSSASKKMMNSAFFGQLIILIVFIPILTLEGVEGKMFQPMALTFIFAMIGAMILCLTYVPMVSALFLRQPKSDKPSIGDKVIHWMERTYEPLLIGSLKRGRIILGTAILLFFGALVTFSRLGGEFIPQLDEGDIAFHAILKPGSSLTETIETTTKIEKIVKSKFPEALKVISRIGVADVPTDPMPMDIADVFVILKDKSEWTTVSSKEELIKEIKEAVSAVPGINFEFTQPIEMRFNELITGVREDVAIKLFGDDMQILSNKAEEIGKLIAGVEGVGDLKVEATTGQPQISVDYKRNKLAQYGLHINELNMIVQSAFAGSSAGVIFEGEKRFDLVVRLSKLSRTDLKDIENLYISTPTGSQIPLREIAEISYQPGPMQISRDNTNRRTYVGINIRDRDVQSVVMDIQEILDEKLDLPPGYYIRYGGAFENLERASNRLKTVVPLALLLIFILIYFALKSVPQTLVIYGAIPMATIGGVVALYLRDMPFSISAGVGFIVLFGVAVLNGLVMISGLNELKDEGVTDLNDRIIKGTKRRIRPIMLTAFTDILGFLPMAISAGAGAEVQRPLATVVIGGLLTSTLLTLFVLPILYHWLEKRSSNRAKRKQMNPALASLIIVIGLPYVATAQETPVEQYTPISMIEAVELANDNFPLLQQKQLELEKQQSLSNTHIDLGSTKLFTGGEEIKGSEGIYTLVGLGQSEIDIFGLKPKKNLINSRISSAEKDYELSKLQVARRVKVSWVEAFKAKKKKELFEELDSIYSNFQKAVELNYEVEAISKLEFLAANNQALQIKNNYNQAKTAYLISLQELNLWLSAEGDYTVSSLETLELVVDDGSELQDHPLILLSNAQVEMATASYKVEKSSRLPTFNIQGGLQKVGGLSGYYTYQVGLSIPFLSGSTKAGVRSAEKQQLIAQSQADYTKREIETHYQKALSNYNKWKTSWEFYSKAVLPVVEQQRDGALLAYKEGAIDYAGFTQIINQAIQSEIDAYDTYAEYLKSMITLEYFKS